MVFITSWSKICELWSAASTCLRSVISCKAESSAGWPPYWSGWMDAITQRGVPSRNLMRSS